MQLDHSDPHNYPKPVNGSVCELAGDIYTVSKVSPKGRTAVLRRVSDGREVKVKRAPVGRLPMELCKADVSPRYYDDALRRRVT
jgi:hypothetical protein